MIEVICLTCSRALETDFPGKTACPCGSRCFEWDDAADKPRRNYDRMTVAWGGREVAA